VFTESSSSMDSSSRLAKTSAIIDWKLKWFRIWKACTEINSQCYKLRLLFSNRNADKIRNIIIPTVGSNDFCLVEIHAQQLGSFGKLENVQPNLHERLNTPHTSGWLTICLLRVPIPIAAQKVAFVDYRLHRFL